MSIGHRLVQFAFGTGVEQANVDLCIRAASGLAQNIADAKNVHEPGHGHFADIGG